MNKLRTLLTNCWLLLHLTKAAGQMMKQTDSSIYQNNRIIPIERANLLKNIYIIFNRQYANNSNFQNGSYTGSNFAMNQFRLEIRGQVLDNVFFRFHSRYTRDSIPQTVDHTNHSVDMAFMQIIRLIQFNDRRYDDRLYIATGNSIVYERSKKRAVNPMGEMKARGVKLRLQDYN